MNEFGLLEYGALGVLSLLLFIIVKHLWAEYQKRNSERLARMEERIGILERVISKHEKKEVATIKLIERMIVMMPKAKETELKKVLNEYHNELKDIESEQD